LDHFQLGAAPFAAVARGIAGEYVDARRCTVQFENGHLYLDAIAAPSRALLGYDAPPPVQLSVEATVARIDGMSETYRCIALTAGLEEAVTIAADLVARGRGEQGPHRIVKAEQREREDSDEPLIALENESLGRSGRWLASTGWNRPPDAIVIGDALAGGAPFAAVLADKANCEVAMNTPWITCPGETLQRAGAMIEAVLAERLLEQVPALDRYLHERIDSVRATCGDFGAVDFSPLRAVITMPTLAAGARLKRRLCERGVLVGLDEQGRVVVAPPLVIRPAEIDVISGALRAALVDRPWRPAACCPACEAIAAE
jgi:Aminotransferase class-III